MPGAAWVPQGPGPTVGPEGARLGACWLECGQRNIVRFAVTSWWHQRAARVRSVPDSEGSFACANHPVCGSRARCARWRLPTSRWLARRRHAVVVSAVAAPPVSHLADPRASDAVPEPAIVRLVEPREGNVAPGSAWRMPDTATQTQTECVPPGMSQNGLAASISCSCFGGEPDGHTVTPPGPCDMG
jgi:hypothetical protein